MRPVRVLVVDDQAPFREAASAVIRFTEPFVLVGVVGSAEECLAAVPGLAPDLVLMDIGLPGIDGIEAAARLNGLAPAVAVVLVSTYAEHEYGGRVAGSGAVAYLDKSAFGPDTLLAAWVATPGGRRPRRTAHTPRFRSKFRSGRARRHRRSPRPVGGQIGRRMSAVRRPARAGPAMGGAHRC